MKFYRGWSRSCLSLPRGQGELIFRRWWILWLFSVMESPGKPGLFFCTYCEVVISCVLLVLGYPRRIYHAESVQTRGPMAYMMRNFNLALLGEMHADVGNISSGISWNGVALKLIFISNRLSGDPGYRSGKPKTTLMAGVLWIKTATGSRVVEPTMLDSFV